MFDQPAPDGKARSPIGVHQDIGHPRKPGFVAGLAMAALDLYFACLNVVQLHGCASMQGFRTFAQSHCQIGNLKLAIAEIVSWLSLRSRTAPNVARAASNAIIVAL